jgi:hypothetical protein
MTQAGLPFASWEGSSSKCFVASFSNCSTSTTGAPHEPHDRLSSSTGRHRPGPSPDPDEEIYTIRLFCRVDLRTSPDLHPDLGPWEWLHFE